MTTDMTLDQLERLPVIRVDQLSDLGALVDHNVDVYRAIVEGTALRMARHGAAEHLTRVGTERGIQRQSNRSRSLK
jgi:hypothetical protein